MEANKYYLTEVDRNKSSVYCYHNPMGEVFIERHKHAKGQFIYTEGGIVYIETSTKTYFLPAGHYMWIPPEIEHAIYPSNPGVLMRNLYFPVNSTDEPYFFTEGIYPIDPLLMQLLLYTKKWGGDILRTDKVRFPVVDAFKVLLPEISKNPLKLTLPQPKDPRLIKIIEFMNNHLDQNILFSELAVQFGMSERSLNRLFKSDLKISFIQFFTLLRMFKATEYLIEGRLPIGDIASMVGYTSVPTFSNTFSKIMGQRPSDYRKGDEIL